MNSLKYFQLCHSKLQYKTYKFSCKWQYIKMPKQSSTIDPHLTTCHYSNNFLLDVIILYYSLLNLPRQLCHVTLWSGNR